MRFLIRRVLHSLFLLAGASVLSFALVNSAPGDFFDTLKLNPEISPGAIDTLRQQQGLERPPYIRYLYWLRSGLRGEWGFSLAYGGPAGPILFSRTVNTLLLAGAATLLAWIIALPLGIWAATRAGRWSDWFASGTISVLLATPELVLALLLLMLAVRTGYFPAGGLMSAGGLARGAASTWMRSEDIAHHLILPGICLAAGLLPLLLMHIRTAVRESLQSPFVEAARSYGIPPHRVLLRYVLPAAANPLISLFGLSIGMLMSSSLLIEVIFSWPGLGQLLVDAILQRDVFLVIDSAMLATVFLAVGNLIADLLLYAADPRIRSVES